MYNSRLFNVLEKLQPAELRRAEDFVRSPYFNRDQHVIALFVYIRKYYPELSHPNLYRREVCKALFNQGAEAENKLRAYMSKLGKLLEAFLEHETLYSWPSQETRIRIRTLSRRGDSFSFLRLVEQQKAILHQLAHADLDLLMDKWWLLHEAYFHVQSAKYDPDNRSIENLMDAADEAFIMLKLRYTCEILQRNKRLSTSYAVRLLDEILLPARQFGKSNFLIRLYIHLLELLRNPENAGAYQAASELFISRFSDLSDFDKALGIKLLLTFNFQKINQGDIVAAQPASELYSLADQSDLISPDSRIESDTFLNATVSACLAHRFDWALYFIEKYQAYLPDRERKMVFKIGHAYWYYHQIGFGLSKKDALEKATSLLAGATYLNSPIDLRFRSLQLRVFYEYYNALDEDQDMVLAAAKSFELYLKRSKSYPAHTKAAYLNFERFLRKIISLKQLDRAQNPAAIERLQHHISQEQHVALRNWLLEKLQEIG